MKKYEVEIIAHLVKTVQVEAESIEEAGHIAEQKYFAGEIENNSFDEWNDRKTEFIVLDGYKQMRIR